MMGAFAGIVGRLERVLSILTVRVLGLGLLEVAIASTEVDAILSSIQFFSKASASQATRAGKL